MLILLLTPLDSMGYPETFFFKKNGRMTERPSTEEWKNKMWSVHTMDYSAFRRKEILTQTTMWIGLGDIMISETCEAPKDRYHMCKIPHV